MLKIRLPTGRYLNQRLRCRSLLPKASAKDTIVRYYDAYNAGDIDTIDTLLAEDCSYHDMIYEEPFRGRFGMALTVSTKRPSILWGS